MLALLGISRVGQADVIVPCERFTQAQVADPAPRIDQHARQRFADINAEVKLHRYSTLFLGDSITQRWDDAIWHRYFDTLGALNAGVSGDRTEHLLWRVEHGNLDNQRPFVVVLLIGTNDLGHGREPDLAAEGVRRILIKLRQVLPDSRILLEGLWPRNDVGRLSGEINKVNDLISKCADNVISYQNVGKHLLDRQGQLPRTRAPDGLHLSPDGYQIVSPLIEQKLTELAGRVPEQR